MEARNGNLNPGTDANKWFNNVFTGQVMPMGRPKRRAQPVLEKIHNISSFGYLTELKIYVHAPTLQFPDISVFMQLNNKKGSCFVKIKDAASLKDFARFIDETVLEVEAAIDNLQPIHQQVIAQLNQYEQNMELLRNMQKMGGIADVDNGE